MIPVCRDIESNGDSSMWFYVEGKYVRQDKKGTLKGQISGQAIPNPDTIWRQRCAEMGAQYPDEEIQHPKTGNQIRLKPTEAAFRLFEHWNNICAGMEAACQL